MISTAQRRLYLVLGNGQALSYAIGVGREGMAWSGVTQISDVVGLHSANQRGRHRSLQPGEDRSDGHRAIAVGDLANGGRLFCPSSDSDAGAKKSKVLLRIMSQRPANLLVESSSWILVREAIALAVYGPCL